MHRPNFAPQMPGIDGNVIRPTRARARQADRRQPHRRAAGGTAKRTGMSWIGAAFRAS